MLSCPETVRNAINLRWRERESAKSGVGRKAGVDGFFDGFEGVFRSCDSAVVEAELYSSLG